MVVSRHMAIAMSSAISILLSISISILSRPSSCHAFTVQSASRLRSQLPVLASFGQPSSVVLQRMPSNLSSTSVASALDNSETKNIPWWSEVVLKHSDLPIAVVPDFPILSTTIPSSFPDDDSVTDNDNATDSDKTGIPLIYFDSAATSQKPTIVTDALTSYYHTSNSNVHRGAHSLSRQATEKYEGARDKIASFINASSRNEIIFTSGATEALNLIAATYGRANIQPGDEILITELEHHSNIVPWQMLAQEKNAVLKYIPLDITNGTLDLSTLPTLLTPRTKIVALQHVSNVMGCITPLSTLTPTIRALAHPDVKIVLDACQSVPHMPIDVRAIDVDFLAASGHKMCGPTGIGFLYGRLPTLDAMPPYMGGGEMIDEVTMEGSTYARSPARFEAGTPRIAQAIGLGVAVDYLEGVGMGRIEEYERELGGYLARRMGEVEGVTVLGPVGEGERGTAIVAFVCEGVHPSDLGTFLDMEGIAVRAGHHCCQPLHRAVGISHSARASLYFYNTKEEVDTFICKLEETLAMLGGGGAGGDDDDFVPFF